MADTITLKDGKWNLSKFEVYEYATSNKSLAKIAEDKSISDVVIADIKMEVGEVYIENTKENIEEYNKNEYVFMYVKTDKFYYGYVIKNMLEYLGGDSEIPPDVEEPDIEYEKTIKSQTEYAENNNLKLSKAFTEINAELKKDDNFVASDLFDVDRCIEELKKSRKKWASGSVPISLVKDGEDGYGIINPMVSFEIDEIIINVRYQYSSSYTMCFIIQPYKKNKICFSSIYFGRNSAIRYTEYDNYGNKTFIHYMNQLGDSYGKKVELFQSSLDANKFVVIAGSYDSVKDGMMGDKFEVSYIAFE